MAEAKHTPEPWLLDITEHGFRIRMGSTVPYTGIYKPQHLIEWEPGVYYDPEYGPNDAENKQYLEAEANMRRIVACVNACEGIPTGALEAGVVQLMVKQFDLVAKGLLEMSVFIQDAGKVDRGTLSQLALSMHSAAVSIHNLLRQVRGETS